MKRFTKPGSGGLFAIGLFVVVFIALNWDAFIQPFADTAESVTEMFTPPRPQMTDQAFRDALARLRVIQEEETAAEIGRRILAICAADPECASALKPEEVRP